MFTSADVPVRGTPITAVGPCTGRVGDLGVAVVPVLDAEPVGEPADEHHAVLLDCARRELRVACHRREEDVEPFAVGVTSEVGERGLGARPLDQVVRGRDASAHRQ